MEAVIRLHIDEVTDEFVEIFKSLFPGRNVTIEIKETFTNREELNSNLKNNQEN